MKKLARAAVVAVLGYQVRRLYKQNSFKVIGVAGSIGKTSTKLAIAQVLGAGFKVRYQLGNYNDLVTVPLIFFDEAEPSLYNPLAWIGLFWRNQKQLRQTYPYDVVVVELGSDAPGQLADFQRYLNLEIGVVTAITPEHMQNFASLDEVAKEELSISQYSRLVLANKDLCDENYLKSVEPVLTYSLSASADYGATNIIGTPKLSRVEQYSLLAATGVASQLGQKPKSIQQSLKSIQPVPGRMQKLNGINDSIIIDDSYNASPEAVKLALDYLYQQKAPQKIALLGNMNELGQTSAAAHTQVGELCDSAQLDLVVTLGPDANKYTAPAATTAGCQVRAFDNPYQAGDFIKKQVKKGALILVKGSQNGVFAEEAIKSILANPHDADKLVRQSPEWLKIKQKAFGQ